MKQQNDKSIYLNSSNPLLLKAKDLSHKFDYELFKNISLELYKGESIAIVGISGSGKSTLLNILSTLLTPDDGEVYYKNTNIYQSSQKTILEIRKLYFGIIFQAHYLFRGFSASENLQISELLSGTNIDFNLLKSLKIEHILNQGIGEISGGQQQRLSIARVLVKQPNIIFADEPTGNLDKKTANETMDILFNYIQKTQSGMIIVTHEEELAMRCDKVYSLENKGLKSLKL